MSEWNFPTDTRLVGREFHWVIFRGEEGVEEKEFKKMAGLAYI